jgi:hypothetical protein
MKDPEDVFTTAEFKNLPIWRRLWIRVVIAFYMTIGM